jgi:hypothetical protein
MRRRAAGCRREPARCRRALGLSDQLSRWGLVKHAGVAVAAVEPLRRS